MKLRHLLAIVIAIAATTALLVSCLPEAENPDKSLTFQVDNGAPVSFVPAFTWANDTFVGFHSGFDTQFPTPALTDTEHAIDGRYDNLMMK